MSACRDGRHALSPKLSVHLISGARDCNIRPAKITGRQKDKIQLKQKLKFFEKVMVRVRMKGFRVRILGYGFFLVVLSGQISQSRFRAVTDLFKLVTSRLTLNH